MPPPSFLKIPGYSSTINYMKKKLFIIPMMITGLFFSGCGSYDDTTDFGDPPTPGSCFCDPDGVKTYLSWLSTKYPDYTALRSIGESEDGLPIWVLEISNNAGDSEVEPKIMLNGCIHGDEQIAAGICLKAAGYLLDAYCIYLDPSLQDESPLTEEELEEAGDLVENYRIHIMPALNPDGLKDGIRLNSNYVDLNRNFGYNWDEDESYSGDEAFDQAESAAVRDDFLDKGYCLSLNLHTAVLTKNIGIYAPWDAITTTEEDYDLDEFIKTYLPNYEFIKSIGKTYAADLLEQDYPYSDYFQYGEGGDWYVMYGSMADWALGTLGTVSYTIELYGDQNFTTDDAGLLDEVWNAHRSAMLSLIKAAELGGGGIVQDASGSPLADAVISFDCTSAGSKTFVMEEYSKLAGNSASDGSFRLLTEAGSYNVTITKTGYQSAEIDIEVNAGFTRIDGGSWEFYHEYTLTEE